MKNLTLIEQLDVAHDALCDFAQYSGADNLGPVMYVIESTVDALRKLQAEGSASARELLGILRQMEDLTKPEDLDELKTLDYYRAMEEEVLARVLLDFLGVL